MEDYFFLKGVCGRSKRNEYFEVYFVRHKGRTYTVQRWGLDEEVEKHGYYLHIRQDDEAGFDSSAASISQFADGDSISTEPALAGMRCSHRLVRMGYLKHRMSPTCALTLDMWCPEPPDPQPPMTCDHRDWGTW